VSASASGGGRRVQRAARAGTSTALLLVLMFLGSLGLWVGAPVLWLWIGGRVQGATGSLGAAVGLILFGFVATVLAAVPLLGWLARLHGEARLRRGLEDYGRLALEAVLVVSAAIAAVVFTVWFLFFAGAEPLPLGLPK
jgi:hypothetical protein